MVVTWWTGLDDGSSLPRWRLLGSTLWHKGRTGHYLKYTNISGPKAAYLLLKPNWTTSKTPPHLEISQNLQFETIGRMHWVKIITIGHTSGDRRCGCCHSEPWISIQKPKSYLGFLWFLICILHLPNAVDFWPSGKFFALLSIYFTLVLFQSPSTIFLHGQPQRKSLFSLGTYGWLSY